jgi:pyridinium-3,5-bisthiocarboxylic acid mononucleotide nickel chelatase
VSKTLYFDCFSGASGDMVLGALLDLGLPIEALREALGSLAIDYGTVSSERVLRAGVSATKFRVDPGAPDRVPQTDRPGHRGHDRHQHGHGDDPHDRGSRNDRHHDPDQGHHGHHHHDDTRHQGHDHGHHHHGHSHAGERAGSADPAGHGHHSLRAIGRLIDRSALSPEGRTRARELFQRLAEAEAAVHDMPVDRVHLHEVGAVDSIIDIVGAVFGMEWLGATDIVASPLNVGSGTVRCAHGVFPVPAPATARLLQGVPIYAGGVRRELTTPTGALLVTGYASSFGPLPQMTVSSIGYGAGDGDFRDHPNVLRLLVGEGGTGNGAERIVTIECEIDDMNPQLFGPLMDSLQAAGALDVYYSAVQMKKNRPGVLVTALAPPDRRDAISRVLFTETTTIGVRYAEMARERLDRETTTIETPVGPIRFKVARRNGTVMNAAPEFEDCARAAAARGLPIKTVQALATKAWLDRA